MAKALAELEQRVIRRYAELVTEAIPTDVFNPEEWCYGSNWRHWLEPKLPMVQQYPREQWVTYPNRRAIALTIVDRSLDRWDTLTQHQRWQIDFLMAYGGRERIA